jgi:ferredoxin
MSFSKLTVMPEGVEILLPTGSPLTEVEYESPHQVIPFGCRAGACGSCVIEVVEGGDSLGNNDDDEVEFLEDLGKSDGNHRLACQCRLWGDAIIRVTDD